MHTIGSFNSNERLFPVGWEPDAAALLDHAHLVADDPDETERNRFVGRLQSFLASQRGCTVAPIYGRYVSNLDDFCHQLERIVPVERLDRRIHGLHGVTNALRQRGHGSGRSLARSRHLIWSDADHCLRADPELFGDLIDAIAGVSAEAEFSSEEPLMIQRVVLVGGAALAQAASDPRGPLRSWRTDRTGVPFWRVLTGLDAPPIERRSIADIVAGRAHLAIDEQIDRLARSGAI